MLQAIPVMSGDRLVRFAVLAGILLLAAAARIEGNPTVPALEPQSLADACDDIRRVAGAHGCPEYGDQLVGQMQERMQTVSNAVTPVVAHRRANLDALHDADLDRIVVMAWGFDLSRTDTEMAVPRSDRRWSTLRTVQTEHAYLTDGNHFFNRPGPRLSASLDILAEIRHPDRFHTAFDRSRRGTAWGQDTTIVPSQASPTPWLS